MDCAGACEFVARLQGELDGGEHDAPSRDLREESRANHLDFLHVAEDRWCRTAAGVSSGLVHADSEYSRSSARRKGARRHFDELLESSLVSCPDFSHTAAYRRNATAASGRV